MKLLIRGPNHHLVVVHMAELCHRKQCPRKNVSRGLLKPGQGGRFVEIQNHPQALGFLPRL